MKDNSVFSNIILNISLLVSNKALSSLLSMLSYGFV